MKYDFTSIIDRRRMDAMAVDYLGMDPGFAPGRPRNGFNAIPMWVADMNFQSVPSVEREIARRIRHRLYGYFKPSEEYYQAISWWQKKRNGLTDLKRECIGYENGVLGGVVNALLAFTKENEAVLLHSPVYVGFTNSIRRIGRRIVHSPLRLDEKNIWRMDFEDMNRKIQENQIRTVIFCSPHNPCGRVWERWELEGAAEIFAKNGCLVISDEIWSDILLNGHRHIPLHSVSEDARQRTISLYAPTKTFNMAGLDISYHLIFQDEIRRKIREQAAKSHYNAMNVLSMHGLIGAYGTEGAEWTDELCQVLSQNINFACDYISKYFAGVKVPKPEGTYMLLADCTDWCEAHHKTLGEILHAGWDVGVSWQDGRAFYAPCSLRLNLALPFTLVEEAFERMRKYVFV